jgi:serine kinase of HPr protein (carbohydrate metabolism regulator)
MEKIDGLGWAAGLGLVAYGLRIGIRASSRDALDRLVSRLPPGWAPGPSSTVDVLYSAIVSVPGQTRNVRRYHLLYAGSERLARTLDSETLLDTFDTHVRLLIAGQSRRRVFVHAGVVGWHGRAILLPGRSHAGKSTMVTELVRRGAVYFSDEYAVLDGKGRVHPYARPIALLTGHGGRVERIAAAELGGTVATAAMRVGAVVMTEYHPEARWAPRRLSPGRGLLEMLAHTIPAQRRPAAALAALGRIVSVAPVFKGRRGEASATADLMLERLS